MKSDPDVLEDGEFLLLRVKVACHMMEELADKIKYYGGLDRDMSHLSSFMCAMAGDLRQRVNDVEETQAMKEE